MMLGSRDPLVKFLDLSYTSRLVEARNLKFGTETDEVSSNAKKMQNWVKRVMSGSRDPHLKFWVPQYLTNG